MDKESKTKKYENLSAPELFAECLDRLIRVDKRKGKEYYINKLIDYDEKYKDVEDKPVLKMPTMDDYEKMTTRELFLECRHSAIAIAPLQAREVYLKLLEERLKLEKECREKLKNGEWYEISV